MANKILKEIGKVFRTDVRINECPCGGMVTQEIYSQDDKKQVKGWEGWRVIAGFCECGNIFMTDRFNTRKEHGK